MQTTGITGGDYIGTTENKMTTTTLQLGIYCGSVVVSGLTVDGGQNLV